MDLNFFEKWTHKGKIWCVDLSDLRDALITGKTPFLSMSVRVAPEEITFGISRWSKDHPHQYQWNSSNLLSTNIEQKGGGKVNLLELRHPSSALGHQHSWFLDFWIQAWIYTVGPKILRLSNLDRIIPPVFQVLQFTDSRLWDFLASITTWANFYNNKFS